MKTEKLEGKKNQQSCSGKKNGFVKRYYFKIWLIMTHYKKKRLHLPETIYFMFISMKNRITEKTMMEDHEVIIGENIISMINVCNDSSQTLSQRQ